MAGNLVLTIVAVLLIGTPIATFVALSRIRDFKEQILRLRQDIGKIEAELVRLRKSEAPPPAAVVEAAPVMAVKEAPPVAREPIAAPKPPAPPPPAPSSRKLEQALSERWMVWLGGVTLALGGVFLVKYSVEQGLLSPAVRVFLGVLLGIAIASLGHWLSRHMPQMTFSLGDVSPSHVPPALIGAGTSMVFASLYAAYGLYDLLPSGMAFAALSLVAVATALLSLRHGPYVALLGLLGGFIVPALVPSDHPSAFALFSYLLALTAGSVILLRWKQWWWLAWVSLAGCMGWSLVWQMSAFQTGDELVMGAFLLAVFGLFAAFRLGISAIPALSGKALAPTVHTVVLAAACTAAGMDFWLIQAADDSTVAIGTMFALELAFLAFTYRDQAFDELLALIAALPLLVLAAWDLSFTERTFLPSLFALPLPKDAEGFSLTAGAISALLGIGGFVLMRHAVRPWRWAALSAAAPVLMAAVAYWRLSSIGIHAAWTTGILILTLLLLAASHRVARIRSLSGMEEALGAYAVGVIAGLALAATITFEEAWLTVSLSLTLPGIAWVDKKLRVIGLRQTALVVASIVLIRLVLNPYIPHYPLGDNLLFNWLLYGYGLPACAFAVASRHFRRAGDDLTSSVLESGAILFSVLLVSLEIHNAMEDGQAWGSHFSLAERSLQSIVWLGMSAGLFALYRRHGRVIPYIAACILLGLASFQTVLFNVLAANPYFTNQAIGETPVFNLLLLAFALPAVFCGAHALLAPSDAFRRPWCSRLSRLLAFLWLSLEVRHTFAGSHLAGAITSNAELYAYSLAWLAYAAVTLAIGIGLGKVSWRRWGLGTFLLVVAKVFLVDMSQLTGIWRALSFLGLGAALIAVGWLYRRFVRIPQELGENI